MSNNLPSFLRPDPRPYRDWDCLSLEILCNRAYSDSGDTVRMPPGNDKEFWVACCEDTIRLVNEERARRKRAGQPERATAPKDARAYPPDLLRRIREAFDLRDVVAQDIGYAKPLDRAICSPLRPDDDTPSFRVYADHYFDYGSHEVGDVFDWRMRMNPGVSFLQAVESLAVEAGIALPDKPATRHRRAPRLSDWVVF